MAGVSSRPLRDGELRVYVNDADELPTMSNVDVEVLDRQKRRWSATFFTIDGVEALFQKNTITGECLSGTYLWASNMVLVRSLSIATIERAIDHLQESGEFEQAFALL